MAFHDPILKNAALAIPLAGAALVPGEAEACQEPCFGVYAWASLEPINAAAIPIDGVLLLQADPVFGSPPDFLDLLEITVTRDGQPIAGAIETSAVDDVLIWRPAAPLEPGATYQVTGSFDNLSIDEFNDYCAPESLTLDFEFHADTGPSTPLGQPVQTAQASVSQTEVFGVADLVCCDGGMPFVDEPEDSCGYSELSWEPGFCATRLAVGTLHVELSIAADVSLATAGMLATEVILNDTPSAPRIGLTHEWFRLEEFCTAVVLHNLATGEASPMSEETCHGSELQGQIGPLVLDPTAELAANCSEAPYVCALTEDLREWDPAMCSPWPSGEETDTDTGGEEPTGGPGPEPTTGGPGSAGETDNPASGGQDDGLVKHGCACDSTTPTPGGLLGLAALGLSRRRRRRR